MVDLTGLPIIDGETPSQNNIALRDEVHRLANEVLAAVKAGKLELVLSRADGDNLFFCTEKKYIGILPDDIGHSEDGTIDTYTSGIRMDQLPMLIRVMSEWLTLQS